MRKFPAFIFSLAFMFLAITGCPLLSPGQTESFQPADEPVPEGTSFHGELRLDGAEQVNISVAGSLQNPQWSPDGNFLLFTRFEDGYNGEPADLMVVRLDSGSTRTLVADGSGNINLPGSSWNALTGEIVFSSSREPHDEIYLIDEDGSPGDESRITERTDRMAYEPSFSPDGQWIVFESHELDVEDNGVIVRYRIDGSMPYTTLTPADEDCRQPNWSPDGEHILFQKFNGEQWDIWIMDSDGTHPRQITVGPGNKTDGAFSPDGECIVYSSDEFGGEAANLVLTYITNGYPIRLTHFEGYDGAPSWSPDGERIAFESYPGDPDDSPGTTIWVIEVPQLYP